MNVRAIAATSLAMALAAPLARAERPIRVTGAGDGPFEPAELVAALRVRIPDRGPAIVVQIRSVAADRVTVAIAGREQAVELGTRRGPEAARLVALAIADSADDAGPELPSSAPGTRAASIGHTLIIEPAPWTLEVGGFGGVRVWNSVLAGASGELALEHAGWVGAIELAGDRRIAGDLSLSGFAVRASGGRRSGVFEVRGGVVVAPIQEHDGAGDSATLIGGCASLRVRGRLGHGIAVVAAAGIDAYATQTTYVLGARSYMTPWIAPWIGLGTEVAL